MELTHNDSFSIIRENYKRKGCSNVHNKLEEKREEQNDDSQIALKIIGEESPLSNDNKLFHVSVLSEYDYCLKEEDHGQEEGRQYSNQKEENEIRNVDFHAENRVLVFNANLDSYPPEHMKGKDMEILENINEEEIEIDGKATPMDKIENLGFTKESSNDEENEISENKQNKRDVYEEIRKKEANLKKDSVLPIEKQNKEPRKKLSNMAKKGAANAYSAFRNFFRALELTNEDAMGYRSTNIRLQAERIADGLSDDKIKFLRRKYSQQGESYGSELDDSVTRTLQTEAQKRNNEGFNEYRCDLDSDTYSTLSTTEDASDFYIDPSFVFTRQNGNFSNLDVMEGEMEEKNESLYYSNSYSFPYDDYNLSTCKKSILKNEKEARYSQEFANRVSIFIEEHLKHIETFLARQTGIEMKTDQEQIQNRDQLISKKEIKKMEYEEGQILTPKEKEGTKDKETLPDQSSSISSSLLSFSSIHSSSSCLSCKLRGTNISLVFHDGESFINLGNGLGEHNSTKLITQTDDLKIYFSAIFDNKYENDISTCVENKCMQDLSRKFLGPFICLGRDISANYPLCTRCHKSRKYSSQYLLGTNASKGTEVPPVEYMESRALVHLGRQSESHELPGVNSLTNIKSIDTYTTRYTNSRSIGRLEGQQINQGFSKRDKNSDVKVSGKRTLFVDELPLAERTSLHQSYVSSSLQYSFSSRGVPEFTDVGCCTVS